MTSFNDAQQHFRSNRKHRRIHAALSCQVGSPGGKLSAAQVLDLSIGGMKFSCSQDVVSLIIPEGMRTVGLIMDVDINILLKLPTDKKRATVIKSAARLVHSERLSQDEFHVGVNFTSLTLSAIQLMETYIDCENDYG